MPIQINFGLWASVLGGYWTGGCYGYWIAEYPQSMPPQPKIVESHPIVVCCNANAPPFPPFHQFNLECCEIFKTKIVWKLFSETTSLTTLTRNSQSNFRKRLVERLGFDCILLGYFLTMGLVKSQSYVSHNLVKVMVTYCHRLVKGQSFD